MPRHRKDPPGGFRPPTPYPSPSDPTWGTFEKSRGGRHLLRFKNFREPVYTTEVVCEQPRRFYRHVAPYIVDRGASSSRFSQDRRPAVQPQIDPQNTKTAQAPPSVFHVVERHNPVKASIEDPAIQRQIDAQNAEIAKRPPHRSSHRSSAGAPRRTDEKRVRFQLPEPATRDKLYPGDGIVEQFDRLDVKDSNPRLTRCSLCGQRLRY